MPRFYFHLRDDVDVEDDEGAELPSLAVAQEYAVTNARALAAESVLKGRLNLAHRIDIGDESGGIVGAVTFADAVKLVG